MNINGTLPPTSYTSQASHSRGVTVGVGQTLTLLHHCPLVMATLLVCPQEPKDTVTFQLSNIPEHHCTRPKEVNLPRLRFQAVSGSDVEHLAGVCGREGNKD